MRTLCSVTIGNTEIPWNFEIALFALLAVLALLVLFLVIVVAVLLHRMGNRTTTRYIVGFGLMTDTVKKRYAAGENFDPTGLRVFAEYNAAPLGVELADYEIVPPDMTSPGKKVVTVIYAGRTAAFAIEVVGGQAPASFAPASETVTVSAAEHTEEPAEETAAAVEPDGESAPTDAERKLVGLTVEHNGKNYAAGDRIKPADFTVTAHYSAEPYDEHPSEYDLTVPVADEPGDYLVLASYGGMTAETIVAVGERREAPASASGGTVALYNKSFTACFLQSDDETKNRYSELKNDLLAYKKVRDRMSWKRESYRFNKEVVARFAYRGKTLCLFLALDPAEFLGSKYKIDDMSGVNAVSDTPLMYRIKNEKRVRYAKELIATMMERLGTEKMPRSFVNYYKPYMDDADLIENGYVKLLSRNSEQDEFIRTHS